LNLQPERDPKMHGMAPSRGVLALVWLTQPGMAGQIAAHLLSCHHLSPVEEGQGSARIQKRRCLACLALEQARPPVKTLVVVKRR
jgi:hypothetical protein